MPEHFEERLNLLWTMLPTEVGILRFASSAHAERSPYYRALCHRIHIELAELEYSELTEQVAEFKKKRR